MRLGSRGERLQEVLEYEVSSTCDPGLSSAGWGAQDPPCTWEGRTGGPTPWWTESRTMPTRGAGTGRAPWALWKRKRSRSRWLLWMKQRLSAPLSLGRFHARLATLSGQNSRLVRWVVSCSQPGPITAELDWQEEQDKSQVDPTNCDINSEQYLILQGTAELSLIKKYHIYD